MTKELNGQWCQKRQTDQEETEARCYYEPEQREGQLSNVIKELNDQWCQKQQTDREETEAKFYYEPEQRKGP